MEYLKQAQLYAQDRGDDDEFRNLYTGFRQYNGVNDSVWKTLAYLYGAYYADLLELTYVANDED